MGPRQKIKDKSTVVKRHDEKSGTGERNVLLHKVMAKTKQRNTQRLFHILIFCLFYTSFHRRTVARSSLTRTPGKMITLFAKLLHFKRTMLSCSIIKHY